MRHLHKAAVFILMASFSAIALADSSVELESMQKIEPGFVPKDERATELFKLQTAVKDAEDKTNKKVEEADKLKSLLGTRVREEVAQVTADKSDTLHKKLDRLVDEAITQLEIALKDYPADRRYSAHALYNLGRYYFEQDEKNYFEKLARYNEAREKGIEEPYPEENFSRTIDTYEKLLKEHPHFGKLVWVYYLMGLALWYEGAFYNAVGKFEELLKQFPHNRLEEEIWFRLGEFFYDMDDYEEAIRRYNKVAANPKSPFYDKAIYKIAWSYYQMDQFMKSAEYFIKVIEITAGETNVAAATGMRAEAIRYVVKNFAEELAVRAPPPRKPQALGVMGAKTEKDFAERAGVQLTERISNYFKQKGNPPYVREILLETASQLIDQSKIDGAVLALKKLIELDPMSPENPRIASQIVDTLEEADRPDEARNAAWALLEQYGKTSPWYLSQQGNPTALKHAREAVRDAMLSLAVQYHKSGKEKKAAGDIKGGDQDFAAAAKLYLDYIEQFPERDDTYKAIFYFAESSYEMNHFRAALDAYSLLKNYPLPMPDNFRRDAVYNIVFTFRHVLESEAKVGKFKEIDFDHLTAKSKGTEPEEIPELGRQYLAAIDDFLKTAPTDERVPVLLFHAAAIFYVYGHGDEAMKRFFYIVDNYPDSQAARVASRLIIDDAVAKKDWQRVIELADRFKAKNLDQGTGDFARIESEARFKIAGDIFQKAAKLKEENQLGLARAKYKESAKLFSELLKENPNSPYADVMLFNIARAVLESGTMLEALPLYRELYTKYPNSEYAKTARFQEALTLEKMLKFADAAKAYDAIIKLYPKSESAAFAMLNKALLYEAAGNFAEAAVAYMDFAKSYPEQEEAPEAMLAAAALYKKLGKTTLQISMLDQFVRRYRADESKVPAVIEAYVQIGDTYGDLAKHAKSKVDISQFDKLQNENYKSAVGLYHPGLGSPAAAFFAAKARLHLEESEQKAFQSTKITANNGKGQAAQMASMLKKLTELKDKNEAIIRTYTQPVSNAEALRRIGALYEHLAKAMVKAPCPKDVAIIDEFACDEYLVLLEDKALVLEEKATAAYRESYEIASSAYDAPADLVDKILAGLNRMKPGEYQHVGTLIEKPVSGHVYGQGRMLSTGEMASHLHPGEADPDKTVEASPKEIP